MIDQCWRTHARLSVFMRSLTSSTDRWEAARVIRCPTDDFYSLPHRVLSSFTLFFHIERGLVLQAQDGGASCCSARWETSPHAALGRSMLFVHSHCRPSFAPNSRLLPRCIPDR